MFRRLSFVAVVAGVSGNLYGEVLMNPSTMAQKQGQVGIAFASSKVDYDIDNHGSTEIDRKILGGEVAFKVANGLDAVLQLGSIQDSQLDIDNHNGFNGDGYLLGGGVRAQLLKQDKWNVTGYGLFTMTREEDTFQAFKANVDLNEIQVGAVARLTMTNILNLYGGVEAVPYSEGKIKLSELDDQDIERQDFMNLRVGANYQVQKMLGLRAEMAFLGEETITVAGNFQF